MGIGYSRRRAVRRLVYLRLKCRKGHVVVVVVVVVLSL